MGTFPFGRPASLRPPRPALSGAAQVFVLGVYPSALHVRWTRPDGKVHVQSLAVDDEPEVFWDGMDAVERVEHWKQQVGWQRCWGSATPSGNGTSGRGVLSDVLEPLGIAPEQAFFTDCYRRYLVKHGAGSQGAAMDRAYAPFAAARGLPPVDLPERPTDPALVRMAIAEDGGEIVSQLQDSGADLVVTLGQPAADVFAAVTGAARPVLRRDMSYGLERQVRVGGRAAQWLPLKHPGQRAPAWVQHHQDWIESPVS